MKVTAVVGTQKGAFILRSDESRAEWRNEGPIFKGWKVTAVAAPAQGRVLLALASDIYGPAIQTGDGFSTSEWRQAADGPRFPPGDDRELDQIWTIFPHGEEIYAGVADAALFKSEDGGESWRLIEGLDRHPTRASWFPGAAGLCAHVLLSDPQNPDRLWCGVSAVGVLRSDDRGRSWTLKNEGVEKVVPDEEHPEIGCCVHGLAQDPDDANVIFRQDHRGTYRTRNGGDSWERIERGLPSGFGFPIAIDPTTKALFAVPLESDEYRLTPKGRLGVYRSRNGGDSWDLMRHGLPQENTYAGVLRSALAVDSLDPCGIYVGTTSGSLHFSNDRGDTWRTLPHLLPRILCIEVFAE